MALIDKKPSFVKAEAVKIEVVKAENFQE